MVDLRKGGMLRPDLQHERMTAGGGTISGGKDAERNVRHGKSPGRSFIQMF